MGLVIATLLTTALFPFLGLVVGPVQWIVTTVLGETPSEVSVFPVGNDPVVYIVQLALFSWATRVRPNSCSLPSETGRVEEGSGHEETQRV